MHVEIVLLRLVHVVCGAFWLGSALFTALFLLPALAGDGSARGAVLAGLQRRRLFTVLPAAAVLTILTGLRLMWLLSGGLRADYFASPSGGAFAASGAAAVLAFLTAMLVSRPAAAGAARLAPSVAAAEGEMRAALARRVARLQRLSRVAGAVALALLVAGAAGMATARYLA